MSAGSRPGFGPADPYDLRGQRPAYKGKTRKRRPAKSPRRTVRVKGNAATVQTGQPFEPANRDTRCDVLSGLLMSDTRDARNEYPPRDTNANRVHGGGATFWNPFREGVGQ